MDVKDQPSEVDPVGTENPPVKAGFTTQAAPRKKSKLAKGTHPPKTSTQGKGK